MATDRYRRIALVGLAAGLLVAGDLLVPRRNDPRRFDPEAVADLETAMWRSYYDRDRLALALGLMRLLRSQFGFRPLRAAVAAFWGMLAAATFQRGRSVRGYRRALPALRRFYAAVKRDSVIRFNARKAAERELDWWIIHREVARHGRPELEMALARAASIVYGVPSESLAEHAALRAEAMLLRDEWAARDSVTADEWAHIADLLHGSWRSLHAAARPAEPRGGGWRAACGRRRRRARPGWPAAAVRSGRRYPMGCGRCRSAAR